MRRLFAITTTLLLAGSASQTARALGPDRPGATAIVLPGLVELRDETPEPLPQWQAVLARINAEAPIYARCERHPRACRGRPVGAWTAMLARLRGRPRLEQLDAVNRFVNARPYRSDEAVWGVSDYWATPLQFLGRSGDCEDYAITKYVSMRRLGMAATDLRLVVVRDTTRDLAHAVLAARVDHAWLILDNLATGLGQGLELTAYVPYYSVNEEARWVYVPDAAVTVASTRTVAAPASANPNRR